MSRHVARGESLVELIVALVILEIVGAAALAGALTVERFNRHAVQGATADVSRWQDYRVAETQASCVAAPAPDSIPLRFPATPDRPGLATVVRCGR